MAFHNVNFKVLPLISGSTYNISGGTLGNNITGSTVHEIFCISAGTISVTALGGGSFIWPATAGQNIHVMCSQITVNSGGFVGFMAQSNNFKSWNSSGL